ncbi:MULTISPECIES: hypothetical protein [unclassified Oceanispirochaeta]|uniref:hypothetical protein n=1 Tax=unclassified Oceanispirochaeta TaxID=2635722 RepID=UPI000E098674|nr:MULTISPECIES: hypothetical protein [unclassified Oceanispirochaeta]MBF9014307.1 hypothetical protein [Oceanispirochaeta sp. M2]NPD71193.1 hypothetical protein [Oceanispirochaeta sp. M1]RDG33582.1 hypothetical protein DV872_03680 [Oceanispirochaeta sp. M1]
MGTYLENETNIHEEHRESDLQITPALTFAVSNDNLPLYLKVEAENRMAGDYYFDELDYQSGHTVRQKIMLGGTFGLGKVSFNPEYELRINTPARGDYLDSNMENRFKMNFGIPLGSQLTYINLMPTFKVNANQDNNFYSETEIGYKHNFNNNQSAAVGIYNEFEKKDELNAVEFQARLYYNHKFDNGISLNPFARIGLYRHVISEGESAQDLRRDRVGIKTSYNADNGLSPYTEMWYQNTNIAEDKNRHTILWKVGVSYSF